MPRAVLALNAGSSSIKFALYEISRGQKLSLVAKGAIEEIDRAPHFSARDGTGQSLADRRWEAGAPNHEVLLREMLDWIDDHLGAEVLVAVGHRIVHGGRDFTAPARLDEAVIDALDALTPLAPLHQPHSLEPVRAIAAIRPGLPQIACFDTAFHHTLPAVATRFALPRAYEAEGVRRYGFHGLSYEYIARRLKETHPHLARGRVIAAHLGNGASLCAMKDGKSLDTTMGFTALDGLMMGTRCGTIDPGVVLYLLQQKGISAKGVEEILYKKSGLLGVSGQSSDMRLLLDSAAPQAREAVELFVYRIARETAALVGSLGGLDAFVFTAGIGEHAAPVRERVAARLSWLGALIDAQANVRHAERIAAETSAIDLLIIPTDEERMIADHTVDTLDLAAREPAAAKQPAV